MIPVIVHTKTYGFDFNYPPAAIRIDDSVGAVDRLTQACADQNPQKPAGSAIQDVIANPQAFFMSKEVLKQQISNFDSLATVLIPLLSDETIEAEKRFHFARILTALGVRKGFDWGINRFAVKDEWDERGVKQLLFYMAKKEWLEDVDAWSLLEPRLEHERYGDRSAGEYHFPQQMMAWYIAECKKPETSDDARQAYFRALSGFAPTLAALKSCDRVFKPGPEKFEDWAREPELSGLLQRFVDGSPGGRPAFVRDESEVAEIKSVACRFASRVAGHRHGKSQMYHRFICVNGDEEYRQYFEDHLGNAYYQYQAFEALVRLEGDNAIEFLRKHANGFPGQESNLQDQATRMLAERLDDVIDAELVDSLLKIYHATERWEKKLSIVKRLFQAGATEMAEELREDVATNAPAVYFRRPLSRKWNEDGLNINRFLADLQAHGYAKSLSADQVNQAAMPFGPTAECPHPSLLSFDEQAFKALELAGLRDAVNVLTEIEVKMRGLSKLSGGEFDADLVFINQDLKTTSLRFRNQVFEYQVDRPQEHQDPIVLTMIANSLLQHFDVENFFLTFDDFEGMTDINFFYGPPSLAKLLTEKYHMPFLPGSSAYYNAAP
ncbi:hypothetical protein [Rhodopirellula sallentina]|nr:hypothetical protein [Rhodopirellula sallentina]